MIKKILFYFIFLTIFTLAYLSYFGLSTNKFNSRIENKIRENYPKITVRLQDVRALLNITSLSINLETKNPIIFVDKEEIKLKEISTIYKISSIFNNEFAISNLSFNTYKNKVEKITKLLRAYKDSPQLIILDKIIKDGEIKIQSRLNFDNKGNLIQDDYEITSQIEKLSVGLFDKLKLKNLSFNLNYRHNNLNLSNLISDYMGIKIQSDKIIINKKNEKFFIRGNFKNFENIISKQILSIFLKEHNFDKVILSSNNDFSFNVTKKLKISDLAINSKIALKEATFVLKNKNVKKYLPSFDNSVEFFNHSLNLKYDKKVNLDGSGEIQIGNKKDKIKYNLDFQNEVINYNLNFDLNEIPLKIDLINFHKKENIVSELKIKGQNNKKKIKIKTINLVSKNSHINLDNIEISKDFKISSFKKIKLDYVDINKIKNDLIIKKTKKNIFQVSSNNFDLSKIIDDILFSDDESSIKLFDERNRIFKVNFKSNKIDDEHNLLNLNGSFQIKNNKVHDLILDSYFPDKKNVSLTIKSKDRKIVTTFNTDFAKPFVKKYKFIKGFEGGKIDFYSIKENEISDSELKIYDFRLKEKPALTKILTLASLQGIADILSGEGVGFDEFEMNFQNKKKLIDIKEIYAIGPAISILMEGYVQGDSLISLRGTLVPATTINKFVGSIPILGDILVGKKTGEGVFGVSFKIKGPPKDLKTTVNPIKTLTPRFITRTLEKIKKTN